MTGRTTLALPIDAVRHLDHTVTQTQLDNNTFQGTPDDRDMLQSLIEDAEDEFRQKANVDMRLSRAGSPGRKETYEQLTYSISGHESFKRSWTQTSGNYDAKEVTKDLRNDRVLPFDPTEGDEAYVYRGLGGGSTGGNEWDDVTDEYGDTWGIVDHRSGTISVHPIELVRAMMPSGRGVSMYGGRLSEFRLAISYRYGSLGGSRGSAGSTTLTGALTASETTTVGVENANRLPGGGSGGSYTFKIGGEYVEATVDVDNDEIDVLTRGVRGTTGESHSSGDRVQYTPPGVRKAVSSRAAMGLIQSGRYSAYLPDSDDDLSKGDVMDRLEATWTSTIEAMS